MSNPGDGPEHPKARERQRTGLLRRFRRATDGVAAVEFAIVAVPFFLMLFAIIESALMFFVSQVLDSALTQAARQIRTGEAQAANMSAATFKTNVCNEMFNLVDCSKYMYIDIQVYSTFANYTKISPVDSETGKMKATVFNIGGANEIIVAKAYYLWPIFFNLLQGTGTKVDGRRILTAVVAFRNEPFPW